MTQHETMPLDDRLEEADELGGEPGEKGISMQLTRVIAELASLRVELERDRREAAEHRARVEVAIGRIEGLEKREIEDRGRLAELTPVLAHNALKDRVASLETQIKTVIGVALGLPAIVMVVKWLVSASH